MIFMSEDEIFADLIEKITDEDTIRIIRQNFTALEGSDADTKFAYAYSRMSFGMSIRNVYHLWMEDNPYTVTNPPPNENGIIDNPLFPDNFSGKIIERLIEYYSAMGKGI